MSAGLRRAYALTFLPTTKEKNSVNIPLFNKTKTCSMLNSRVRFLLKYSHNCNVIFALPCCLKSVQNVLYFAQGKKEQTVAVRI